jgi:hypothetical protein
MNRDIAIEMTIHPGASEVAWIEPATEAEYFAHLYRDGRVIFGYITTWWLAQAIFQKGDWWTP